MLDLYISCLTYVSQHSQGVGAIVIFLLQPEHWDAE